MEKDYHYLYDYVLKIYSKEAAKRIMKGIKNPAKYQWITQELNQIYQRFKKDNSVLKYEDFSKLSQIIEDELAYALMICQDSKCDPLKFVNFNG